MDDHTDVRVAMSAGGNGVDSHIESATVQQVIRLGDEVLLMH